VHAPVPAAQLVTPQVASVLQPTTQQKLPLHRPLEQSLFCPQEPPALDATQAPPLQKKPETHWLLVVQDA